MTDESTSMQIRTRNYSKYHYKWKESGTRGSLCNPGSVITNEADIKSRIATRKGDFHK